mgnify:CR=1 FL=1
MIVFIVIILAMIGVFSLRLYKTQAAVTEESLVAADADSMTYQSTVEAARGNILDRNGNVLVSNRATYNIVIINYVLANTGAPNENILKLLQMCQQLGIECQSHFPVTKTKPYEYDMQSLNTTWQNYFRMFLNNRDYDLDISASTLMRNLREEHGYTYGVVAAMVNFERAGYFAVATQVGTDVARDALREIRAEIERLRTEPMPGEELELVKNMMTGEMMRILDGPFGIADVTIENILCGTDNGIIAENIRRIRNTTPDDVRRLAHKYLSGEELVTVVAGAENPGI